MTADKGTRHCSEHVLAAWSGLAIGAVIALPLSGACHASHGVVLEEPMAGGLASQASADPAGGVTVSFFGTTSILVRDTSTAILIDPFVTRPRPWQLAATIRPDRALVDAALKSLQAIPAAAVIASHTHYDHVMDAAVFAEKTGALLVGSGSAWNVGWGAGLAPERMRIVRNGDCLPFGAFQVTFLQSRHGRPELFPGTIDRPLEAPARVWHWKTGDVFSILLKHQAGSILVHPSAGYEPGALTDVRADVVYLGVSGLGRASETFVGSYWHEVVRQTRARRIVLIHWDDFTRPLEEPLQPRRSDRFDRMLDRVLDLACKEGVEVALPAVWTQTNPFAGLKDRARATATCTTGAISTFRNENRSGR